MSRRRVLAYITSTKMYVAFVFILLAIHGESRFTSNSSFANTLNVNRSFTNLRNETSSVAKTSLRLNETALANFTYTMYTNESAFQLSSKKVDCFGLGETVARFLEWYFMSEPNGSYAMDVQFFLSSRRQPRRVQVVLGEQFGLEWTDFRMERRTVIIVHGFLSNGDVQWVKDMERAFLQWGDVNVAVIDWSVGSNTWNYYKAAVNTRIVGYQVSRFIEHLANTTISDKGPDTSNWGSLHLIGHSLGAHICGFAARELKNRHSRWLVQRITGLDPAQPCFRNTDPTIHLHSSDAPFVDVLHTNGRFVTSLGLGFPESIGHMDFYLNGGKTQPGCKRNITSYVEYLQIPADAIRRAICSHGRSYEYFTESLLSAITHNCTFWAHRWNRTYRHLLQTITNPCDNNTCTEMGIRAELYNERGTFYVATDSSEPYCINNTDIIQEVRNQLEQDYYDEIKD